MYTNQDLIKLRESLRSVQLLEGKNNEMGGYKNPTLICIDAVLSINRKYYDFVVPRVKNIQENHSQVDTLFKLKKLLKDLTAEEFAVLWKYNHLQRIKILSNLTDRLIALASLNENDNANEELLKLRLWAANATVCGYKIFGVQGIGIATYQYIRMLLGAKTVKPDVHIKRYVHSILNKNLNEIDTINIFELACKAENIDIAKADHTLWVNNANNVEKEYKWENDKWIQKL